MTQVSQLKQMMRLYYGQNLRELNHSENGFDARPMSPGDGLDAGLVANLNRYLREIHADDYGVTANVILSPANEEELRLRTSTLQHLAARISPDMHLDQLRKLDPDAAFACAALMEDLPESQQKALVEAIAQRVRDANPPTTEHRTALLQQESERLESMLPKLEAQNALYYAARQEFKKTPEGQMREAAADHFQQLYAQREADQKAGRPVSHELNDAVHEANLAYLAVENTGPRKPDAAALLRAERPDDVQGLAGLRGMDGVVKDLAAMFKPDAPDQSRPQTAFLPKSRSAMAIG